MDIFLYREQRKWKEEIVFPISYREEFARLFEGGWSANETIRWNTIWREYDNRDALERHAKHIAEYEE